MVLKFGYQRQHQLEKESTRKQKRKRRRLKELKNIRLHPNRKKSI